jgi:hypothetical protein
MDNFFRSISFVEGLEVECNKPTGLQGHSGAYYGLIDAGGIAFPGVELAVGAAPRACCAMNRSSVWLSSRGVAR